MTDPTADDRATASTPPPRPALAPGGRRRRVPVAAVLAGLAGLVVVVVLAAIAASPGGDPGAGGSLAPGTSASLPAAAAAPTASVAAQTESAVPSPSPGTPGPTPTDGPPSPDPGAPAGRIAVVDAGGMLWVVDPRAGTRRAVPAPGVVFGPPAWSPDGTRIAAIGRGPAEAGIHVIDVPPDAADGVDEPAIVYASDERPPFYLSWSPDGARVGFLATEPGGISLRTARADGRASDDGPEADGVLREGAPLYFAWEDADRLLLHVGLGADAFTGAIDLAGDPAGEASAGTGDFRATAASGDGGELAYVRGDAEGSEVVIESRTGAVARRLPVFGPAALAFDPTGDTLGVVAAAAPVERPLAFPFGPLRLVDAATGAVRTVIDDSVVGFFWSPDGRTIAALRLATTGGSSTAARPATAVVAVAGREAAAASPEPDVEVEVRLTFIDTAGGEVRSDRAVRLGDDFVSTVLPYFDQYALSHRVWAPDGTAIVLPLVDASGRTSATILAADGAEDRPIAEAIHASWSPDGGSP